VRERKGVRVKERESEWEGDRQSESETEQESKPEREIRKGDRVAEEKKRDKEHWKDRERKQ